MTTWLLFLTLANGETGHIETSQYVCEKTAFAVLAGDKVEADVYGNLIAITRAACHGPAQTDPCELPEAGS